MRTLARGWHASIALFVLVALIVQMVIALRASGSPAAGSSTGLLRGASSGERIVRVLSFFTIQSNVLCGVVSAQLAVRPDRDGTGWRALRLAALCGIAVTGIVYSSVLAAIHQPHGAAETMVNTLVHYVVPIMAVVGWAVFGPRPRVTGATIARAVLFPLLWFVYTLIRGAIWHWYPYPFLEVPTHGYARVALNAVLVTAVLGAVAAVFAVGDRLLPPAPRSDGAVPAQSSGV